MFQKARLKLTGWYLLIIVFVSLFFSGIIYKVQINELDRFTQAQSMRFERKFQRNDQIFPEPPFIDADLISETKNRLMINFIVLNGVIVVLSGIFGYILAGKTLRPIKEMVEEQDRFVSDSSHELRTPLTALKSSMEVALMDKNLSLDDAKNLIKENIEDVNRLQNLSDSLIKLSRGKEQKNKLSIEKLSLSELVNSSIDTVKSQADKKEIIIKTIFKKIKIVGDKDKLQSLLTILLDNAVKYSQDKKSIVIKASKAKNSLTLSVADHGQGIAKKDLPYIFDRFFRADTSRSRVHTSGFGLGLSIAKIIVEKHHGTIKVESRLGKGSIFTITLPQNFS